MSEGVLVGRVGAICEETGSPEWGVLGSGECLGKEAFKRVTRGMTKWVRQEGSICDDLDKSRFCGLGLEVPGEKFVPIANNY